MKRFPFVAALVLLALTAAFAQQAASPFTINDLLKVRRVGDPQVSPDGKWVAYTIGDVNKEANRTLTQIYLLPIGGGEPKQLTTGDKSSNTPRWSPDGKMLAFISSREGGAQIWTLEVATGALKKVTGISTGAGDPVWSPDGKMLAFVSDVYPECADDECNRKRDEQAGGSKVTAKVIDRLLFRHWNAWKDGKRTHVFVVPSAGGTARDMTPGDFDAPPFSLGGPSDYAFSPDSKELAFARNTDKVEATSTNSDIFVVAIPNDLSSLASSADVGTPLINSAPDDSTTKTWMIRNGEVWEARTFNNHPVVARVVRVTSGVKRAGKIYLKSGEVKEIDQNDIEDAMRSTASSLLNHAKPLPSLAASEPQRITGDNKGYDLSPQYSPDGRYIAFRSQATAGFEADRWRLMIYDRQTKQTRELTTGFDLQVDEFAFSPDSKMVYFIAGERGRSPVYAVATGGGVIKKVIADGSNGDVKITPDGKTFVFTRASMTMAPEIFRANSDGSGVTQLTKTNEAFLSSFKLRPAEDIEWEGAAGAKIQGWLIKPANFTPDKKYPLLVLIHGGPQSVFSDAWSNRWNSQVFANAGYVVLMPNPRGSIGFGQQFVNDISGDWGGKAYTDIMNGVAHVAAMPFVDRERIGAAGASYGGYMINWIEGHNDDPRFKFKVLVSHDGVFNLTSMYGATEELWFTDWEFKGTPWTNPEMYERWSPHKFVKNFKTPMLVIHGELDYRVPVGEGLQLFTALQLQGVPSKLLYFPDEGHWVLKPQNSELWYNTVIGWVNQYLKP
jgi:dipeptidyl aminopeptidase/acylaminoacyl peptidase